MKPDSVLTKAPNIWLPVLALSVLATISAQSVASDQQQAASSAEKLFAYDQSVPLNLEEVSAKKEDKVTVRDISYAVDKSDLPRRKAYLIQPNGEGPFPALIFFHWLGDVKSDRTEFLDEAIALGQEGIGSILVQGVFPWTREPINGVTDRQKIVEEVVQVRRALDLLQSQPWIDKKRIAYVGHDYGAMYGALTSGVEDRIKAYVLIAGMGTFSDWSLKYWPATAKDSEAYREAIQAVDPINFMPHAAPAALLFQFARTDKYIPEATATSFFAAASDPKEIKWYDANHALSIDAVRRDRHDWLEKQLGSAGTISKQDHDKTSPTATSTR